MSKKFNTNMTIEQAMAWFTSTGFKMAGISKHTTIKELEMIAENALISFYSKSINCSKESVKRGLNETTLNQLFIMIKNPPAQMPALQAMIIEIVGGGNKSLLEIVRETATNITALTNIPPDATLIDTFNVYTQALCTDLNIPMTLPLAQLPAYLRTLPSLATKTVTQALPTLFSGELKQRLEDLVVLRKTTTPSFFMQAMSHPATQALGAILLLGGLAAVIVGILALSYICIALAKASAIACVVVGAVVGAAATMPFFSKHEKHHSHPTEYKPSAPALG